MKKIIKVVFLLIILALPVKVNANTRLVDEILANNPLRTGADFSVVANNANANTQEGLFSAPDNHGSSHFFRGTHQGLNNNVIFAGHQWKILRIEGNSNIRMIYNGECPNNQCTINGNTAGINAIIGLSQFNATDNHNRFVGYMYGSDTGTFAEQHANVNNSTIKQEVDIWFNALPEAARAKTVQTSFCSDRGIADLATHQLQGIGAVGTGLGTSQTVFASRQRLANNNPILTCLPEFRLNLQVGLITTDEVVMAGGAWSLGNNDYFLKINQLYWTMSPFMFATGAGQGANVFYVGDSGQISTVITSNFDWGIRPVISLNSNVTFTGNGSSDNPYIITGLANDNNDNNQNQPEPSIPDDGGTIDVNPPTGLTEYTLILLTILAITIGIYHYYKNRNVFFKG